MTDPIYYILHYGTIAMAVGINSISVGIGEGMTGAAAVKAMNTQPAAIDDISRTAILGMALIETAAIMGTSIAIILLLGVQPQAPSIYTGISEVGIALAICLSGFVIGIASSLPAQAACFAVARQPFFTQNITRLMLLTQSLIQTPIIFGFIVGMSIKYQSPESVTMAGSLRLLASGLAIGLGSIGPAIGLATFARAACTSVGVNRHAFRKIFSFTMISQAIIETPVIFAFVISLMLLVSNSAGVWITGMSMLAAAFCIGIGTIGPGISSGQTAAVACEQIALHPDRYVAISRLSMFSQGIIDTCAIYSLLISFVLLLF